MRPQSPRPTTPGRVALGAAALVLVAGAVLLVQALAHAPVRIAFEPAIAGDSQSSAEPRRARYDAGRDKIVPLKPCYDAQRQPLMVGGETLVLRVRVRDDWPWVAWVRPVRLFVVSVSLAADPVVLDSQRLKAVGAAGAREGFTAAIPIESVEDEIRLFVVASRDPALDATRLQAELRAALAGLSGPAVLTTTTSFLADRLGNVADYQFRVTHDASACPA